MDLDEQTLDSIKTEIQTNIIKPIINDPSVRSVNCSCYLEKISDKYKINKTSINYFFENNFEFLLPEEVKDKQVKNNLIWNYSLKQNKFEFDNFVKPLIEKTNEFDTKSRLSEYIFNKTFEQLSKDLEINNLAEVKVFNSLKDSDSLRKYLKYYKDNKTFNLWQFTSFKRLEFFQRLEFLTGLNFFDNIIFIDVNNHALKIDRFSIHNEHYVKKSFSDGLKMFNNIYQTGF